MKWFHYLVHNPERKHPGLLKYLQPGHFVVCWELEHRMYAQFSAPHKLREYIKDKAIPYHKLCFYEINLENHSRKPYFDIDMKTDDGVLTLEEAEDVVNELKKNILRLVEDAVIAVYTSHTSKKFSFHVVVVNKSLSNHLESKEFYAQAVKEMNPGYHKYIDEGVYSKKQQFRLIGCHKWGKENDKELCERLCWKYEIPKRYRKNTWYYNFLMSLVSVTCDCDPLSGFQPPEKPRYDHGSLEYDEEDLDRVLEMFFTDEMKETFRFLNMTEQEGAMVIILQRLRPSECQICKRVHEHENPFLIVNGDGNIYFDCRRRTGEKKMKYIGSLGSEFDQLIKGISSDVDYSGVIQKLKSITSKEKKEVKKPKKKEEVEFKVKNSPATFFDLLNA